MPLKSADPWGDHRPGVTGQEIVRWAPAPPSGPGATLRRVRIMTGGPATLVVASMIVAGAALQAVGVYSVVVGFRQIRARLRTYGRDVNIFPYSISSTARVFGPDRSDDVALKNTFEGLWRGDIETAGNALRHEITELAVLVGDLNDEAGQRRAVMGVVLVIAGLAVNVAGSVWSVYLS